MEKVLLLNLPERIREIADPPKSLYFEGELPSFSEYKYLCVVGSRKYTGYGREACQKLIAGLAGNNVVIVSGLAIGMDTIAHEAALQNGLKTVAVPGSGLDKSVLYPAQNKKLAERILQEGGALVSELPPTMRAAPYSFPQRNRIMAALSDATLVIEAGEKSGTLITARLVMEYNRDLLVVPGSIFSPASRGANALIRVGAAPVMSSSDILDSLHIKEIKGNPAEDDSLQYSKEEKVLLSKLVEPLSRDEIGEVMQMQPQDLNIILSVLEIKGAISESLGKVFRTF